MTFLPFYHLEFARLTVFEWQGFIILKRVSRPEILGPNISLWYFTSWYNHDLAMKIMKWNEKFLLLSTIDKHN